MRGTRSTGEGDTLRRGFGNQGGSASNDVWEGPLQVAAEASCLNHDAAAPVARRELLMATRALRFAEAYFPDTFSRRRAVILPLRRAHTLSNASLHEFGRAFYSFGSEFT
jgi:hypothetical protein